MKVAVTILNWNGKGFLEKFLPSLFNSLQQSKVEADLIIADNASTDGSIEAYSNNPKIKWIQLDKNYGFTGGYNRAFDQIKKLTDYNYYVLINSDILVEENWLEPLVDFMEDHPEVAVCQPKILSYTRHLQVIQVKQSQAQQAKSSQEHQKTLVAEQFEYAGAAGGFIDKWGFPLCRGRILSCVEDDLGQYDNPQRCFWASGACMVVRSDVWHSLGGLEEKFFAHMEEIDFCWRVALSGYEVWCVPRSKVFHVGGGTLPNNSPRKLYLNYRNNLLMLYRNLPEKGKNTKIFLRKCIDGLSAVCYIFQCRFSYFKSVVKAHRDYSKLKKETAAPKIAESNISTQQENFSGQQESFISNNSEKGIAEHSKKSRTSLPYGMLPFSIIFKFFTGKKKYSQLDMCNNRIFPT